MDVSIEIHPFYHGVNINIKISTTFSIVLQNVKKQNVELQNIELQNVELQNIECYKS